MAIVKFYCTTSSRLPELELNDGNVIFVSDARTLYLDFNGVRLPYHGVKTFQKDGDRLGLLSPLDGWYYVEETNVVWQYRESQWFQITPSDLSPLYFGGEDSFPKTGVAGKLYITDDRVYKWDVVNEKYKVVANNTSWDSLAD